MTDSIPLPDIAHVSQRLVSFTVAIDLLSNKAVFDLSLPSSLSLNMEKPYATRTYQKPSKHGSQQIVIQFSNEKIQMLQKVITHCYIPYKISQQLGMCDSKLKITSVFAPQPDIAP